MNIVKKIIKFFKKHKAQRSAEYRKKIVKKCPNLYRDIHERKGPRESLMCFGFECGSGWDKLIGRLSKKLEKMIKRFPKKERGQFRVIQVKEKYGTLNFYICCGTEKMYKVIEEAEDESSKICEFCGRKGELREHGYWFTTLCDRGVKKQYSK